MPANHKPNRTTTPPSAHPVIPICSGFHCARRPSRDAARAEVGLVATVLQET